MVKSNQSFLSADDRCDIAAFMSVAEDARQRQIVDFGRAAVLTANNVLNLKSEIRVLFGDQTILANVVGSSGNNQSSFGEMSLVIRQEIAGSGFRQPHQVFELQVVI